MSAIELAIKLQSAYNKFAGMQRAKLFKTTTP